MKTFYVFFISILFPFFCLAQWSTGSGKIYYNGGNVGIGTANPSAKLSLGSNASSMKLAIYDAGSASTIYGMGAINGIFKFVVPLSSNRFGFFVSQTGNEIMALKANGNLGLGTSDPSSQFQIGEGHDKLSLGNANSSALGNVGGTSYIGFNAARSNGTWYRNGSGGFNGGSVIYGTLEGGLNFSCVSPSGGGSDTDSDSEIFNDVQMKIQSDGKVGIGTDPTLEQEYMLFVDKGIKTGRVKTDAALADYVFQDGYEVMPLDEVEAFVWENKHLPGVISDKEVQENGGVELTSFTISLQEKLEELYLHVISLEKRVNELEVENKSLKKKKKSSRK